MNEGQRLDNWRFGQKTGSLIRAASILLLSGGATLGLIYASFWASYSGNRLNETRSGTSPSFAQELQDWRRDTTAFLIRAEPNPGLDPRSITYTALAIAGLGTGLLVFGLLERANYRLRLAQAECDRNWQAYQQALQEKAQVEDYATTLATQHHQLIQAKTAKQVELQATKEVIQAQRDQALQELDQANARVEQVTNQYQQALAEKAELEAQIQQLESSIQQALSETADAEAQIRQLEAEKRRWLEYIERSQTDDYKALHQQYETLQQQAQNQEAELTRLQSLNQQLQQKIDAQDIQIQAQYEQYEQYGRTETNPAEPAANLETAIVLCSSERDLYDNEKRDLILEILNRYSPNLLENSRRQHILQDILNANQPTDRRAEIAGELRHLFWDYRSMKSSIRNSLSALGFELIEDGTHYKIVFQQDNRYQITFSKTSSDRRAGRNIVSEIRRRLL